MMKTKVLKLAADQRASLRFGEVGAGFELTVEAPFGQHWLPGIHEIVEAAVKKADEPHCWNSAYERMLDGLQNCDEHCGWWEDEAEQ